MRWTIRQQVLVPILVIQASAIAGITIVSVALAARRAEVRIVNRLNNVVAVLDRSNFPLTEGILERMKGLSGASFVAYDGAGDPFAASDVALRLSSPAFGALPSRRPGPFHTLSDWPAITVDGQRFFASLIETHPSGPRVSLLILYPESTWREARWDSAQGPVILGAGALVLMAVATTWVFQRISARLLRLERELARIAEGDFREIELNTNTPQDEVDDLARSINQMCAQLRQMNERIRRSERTQLLAQLAAGLAHQLRNALTGARMSIQLHARRCETAANDTSMGVALRQLTLTEEQVSGLLTLGRVEERPHRVADLVPLLHDVCSLLQPSSQHAHVELRVGETPAEAFAPLDLPSLRAAVLNLAMNGIEAAGAGGTVVLELFRSPSDDTICVSDTGRGPLPELRESLFDPFVTGKPEGVGLGLALASHVAEAHHGKLVWKREGKLTQFLLSLPRASASTDDGNSP